MDIYDLYKPLRNMLRSLSLLPSLLSVYQLVQHTQFDRPLPAALHWPLFGVRTPLQAGVHEWTLELLVRELILNAPIQAAHAIDHWNEFAGLANLIRDVENRAWGRLPNGEELIRYELVRIAHRQFPWQIRPNDRLIASYAHLYAKPKLAAAMQAAFGMTALELYQIGVAVSGAFLTQPTLRLPLQNFINGVPAATISRFVDNFSISLPDLKARMQEAQRYDINWAYLFDPLRTWPLIRLNQVTIFCPMPTLLFWRLTDGLYFDLVQQGRPFNDNFGPAFEALAKDVVEQAPPTGRLTAKPEAGYGTRQRPRASVDLIVEDDSGVVFVECKSSRLRAQAKADIVDRSSIDQEIERLAAFLVQLYRTLGDALDGAYPHWTPDHRPIFPMVLTLDEWLPSGQLLTTSLEDQVRQRLTGGGGRPDLIDRHPYTICSLYEFEALCKAMATNGVSAVMSGKVQDEERAWAVMPYLTGRFRAATGGSAIFAADWDAIAPMP